MSDAYPDSRTWKYIARVTYAAFWSLLVFGIRWFFGYANKVTDTLNTLHLNQAVIAEQLKENTENYKELKIIFKDFEKEYKEDRKTTPRFYR